MSQYYLFPFCNFAMPASNPLFKLTSLICIIIIGTAGKYFADCKEKAPNKPALDEEAAEQLWVKSKEWTGV